MSFSRYIRLLADQSDEADTAGIQDLFAATREAYVFGPIPGAQQFFCKAVFVQQFLNAPVFLQS